MANWDLALFPAIVNGKNKLIQRWSIGPDVNAFAPPVARSGDMARIVIYKAPSSSPPNVDLKNLSCISSPPAVDTTPLTGSLMLFPSDLGSPSFKEGKWEFKYVELNEGKFRFTAKVTVMFTATDCQTYTCDPEMIVGAGQGPPTQLPPAVRKPMARR